MITTLAGWKLNEDPDATIVPGALEKGLGSPGLFYRQRPDLQIGFFIKFFRAALVSTISLSDPNSARVMADRAVLDALNAKPEGAKTALAFSAARNVALCLLFPESYEAIVSDHHKARIVDHWRSLADGLVDMDDALRSIRMKLAERYG